VNSKQEKSKTFVWISSKNSTSRYCSSVKGQPGYIIDLKGIPSHRPRLVHDVIYDLQLFFSLLSFKKCEIYTTLKLNLFNLQFGPIGSKC
jgi:hypothetical protein